MAAGGTADVVVCEMDVVGCEKQRRVWKQGGKGRGGEMRGGASFDWFADFI